MLLLELNFALKRSYEESTVQKHEIVDLTVAYKKKTRKIDEVGEYFFLDDVVDSKNTKWISTETLDVNTKWGITF